MSFPHTPVWCNFFKCWRQVIYYNNINVWKHLLVLILFSASHLYYYLILLSLEFPVTTQLILFNLCFKNDQDLGVAVLFIQELTFLHSPENQLSLMTTGIHNPSPTKNWGIIAKLENKAWINNIFHKRATD